MIGSPRPERNLCDPLPVDPAGIPAALRTSHPGPVREPDPPTIDLANPLSLPADPRDRLLALAVARAHGIEPPWAGAVLSPRQQTHARLEYLEADVRQLAAAVADLEGRR